MGQILSYVDTAYLHSSPPLPLQPARHPQNLLLWDISRTVGGVTWGLPWEWENRQNWGFMQVLARLQHIIPAFSCTVFHQGGPPHNLAKQVTFNQCRIQTSMLNTAHKSASRGLSICKVRSIKLMMCWDHAKAASIDSTDASNSVWTGEAATGQSRSRKSKLFSLPRFWTASKCVCCQYLPKKSSLGTCIDEFATQKM